MAKLPATTDKPKPIDVFKRQLELATPTIMQMVPKDVPFEKFRAEVVTAVAYNKELLECSTESLLRETAQAASLGLSLNKSLREADILVVWNGKEQKKEAQFRPRYGGLMKLARKSGEIVDIYAHEVRQGDDFDYAYGMDKYLRHKPSSGERGDITHAYVVWQTRDGIKGFEVVDRKRLDNIRDRSEGYKAFKAGKIKSTPWSTDEAEMSRKTAVRAGSKYMPISNEAFHAALEKDVEKDFDSDDAYHGDYMDVTDAPREPQRPSRAAKTQTQSLEDRIAGGLIQPPQELDGPDWTAWCGQMIEAGEKEKDRAAFLLRHKAIIDAAPENVVMEITLALGVKQTESP